MFEILLKIVPLTTDAFKWLLSQSAKKREDFALICDRISEILRALLRQAKMS